jgi:hypothetical protein
MEHIGILEYLGYAVSGAFITAGLAFVAIKALARNKDSQTGSTGGLATSGWQ